MGIAPEERIGTTVGDYVLGSIVGRGGVGVVYSAVDPDGTRVAVKVVKPEIAADETFRRRFQREARIGQTVRHPNVVPVLQIGRAQRHPVSRTAVHRRGLARGDALPRGASRRRDDGPDLLAGGRGAPGAVGRRDGAPRRQAGQHPPRPRGECLHHGLRLRQGRQGHDPDGRGPGAGVDGLHGPGADPRRRGQRRDRRVRARLRGLRVPGGPAAVRPSQGGPGAVGAPAG